jgi:hypothetical protein
VYWVAQMDAKRVVKMGLQRELQKVAQMGSQMVD